MSDEAERIRRLIDELPDFNETMRFQRMAEYGEEKPGDRPERVAASQGPPEVQFEPVDVGADGGQWREGNGLWYQVGEDSGMRNPEEADVIDNQATPEQIDLMTEAVAIVKADGRWTADASAPMTWHSSPGGARLRLSWVAGEVTMSFLPSGWRQMATFERAAVTRRMRAHSVGGLVEFAVAVVAYGLLGTSGSVTGGASRDTAGVAGAPAPMAIAPGQTRLPVTSVGVPVYTGDGRAMDGGMLPTRSHATDAGLDLYTVGQHRVARGQWADLPCGIAIELPDHVWGMVIGRSSALKKRGLLVQISVIDPGYRGPLFVQAMNVRSNIDPVTGETIRDEDLYAIVADKERIGQLVLMPNLGPTFDPAWVKSLNRSERGNEGFGSSGK